MDVVHLTEQHSPVPLTRGIPALSHQEFAVKRDVSVAEEFLSRGRCIQKYNPPARREAPLRGKLKYFWIVTSTDFYTSENKIIILIY